MASLLRTADYPESFFPTAKIEAEVKAAECDYDRMILIAELIGFESMTAWQGRMHEFVNRPQGRRHC